MPFLLLALAGCGTYVKKVDYNLTREVPEDAAPSPLLFRGAEFLIPPGQEIGFESSSSRFCGWPKIPVSRTILSRSLETKYLKEGFKNTLESVGYDVVTGISQIPEEDEDDLLRAEYTISAKIRATQVDLCENNFIDDFFFFVPRAGTDGEVYLSVDWSIYDPIKRAVVYKTTSEGYAQMRRPNQEGLTLLLHEAFEMATHNLGTDAQFHDLVVNGIKPTDWKRPGFKKKEKFATRHIFNPQEEVSIHQSGISKEAFTKNIEKKRQNTVVVHKIGHGSGFFITKQGHLITNAHVVGDSIRTGIILANKKKRVPVEVLRIDKLRDVALLKIEDLDNLTHNYDIVTAPIRTEIPSIGEDIYSIGAPLHYSKYQDTLNYGIVSAYRTLSRNNVKQKYIQSDVEIHGGNSGGPIYDKNGNIIAITVAGVSEGESPLGHGINFFIPIGEALAALDIEINQ